MPEIRASAQRDFLTAVVMEVASIKNEDPKVYEKNNLLTREKGRAGIADPRGGSSSKLSHPQANRLEAYLSKTTYLKVKDIVSYVKDEFGIEYSRTGMTAWMKERGFTFKRPEKIPGKIDPEKQVLFIEEYRKLKDSLGAADDLFFVDAVHPEYQSQVVSGWIKKGE